LEENGILKKTELTLLFAVKSLRVLQFSLNRLIFEIPMAAKLRWALVYGSNTFDYTATQIDGTPSRPNSEQK
jgi:hypothetical protein